MIDSELNSFKRKYFNISKFPQRNIIRHDSITSFEHRELVNRICNWLWSLGYDYYTRVYTKHGEIIDIVAPELPKPFIEVRHSESEEKKYNHEFDDLRIFVGTSDPYKLL